MHINAFSTAPAPAPAASPSPSPAPHAAQARHGDNSFAHFLSRQHEPATAKETPAPTAQKTHANAKAPAPAPAAPRNEAHEPAKAASREKSTRPAAAGEARERATAKTVEPAAAPTAGDETKTPATDAAQSSDGLNPWMALMQSLAAAPAASAAAAAPTDAAAVALASSAAGIKTAAAGSDSTKDAVAALTPGTTDNRAATAKTSATDAAALATREAVRPEDPAANFGATLAAKLAAAPEAGAIGSEWRAREHDAASTAQPAESTAGSSSLAGLMATAPAPSHSTTAAEAVAAITLPTPVHSPEFAPSLAASVSVLAREGVHEAKINLHPAEMGPITVQIAVDGTQARVDFSADVAATRQALEAGLPELASALRDAGLTLSGGGVFDQAREHPGTGGEAPGGRRNRVTAREDDGVGSVAAAPAAARRVSVSGLDEYA